jgi:hypothetical protein
MSVQLGNLIQLLAEKAGVDTTDKSVVDLLSINAQIDEGLFNKLKGYLDSTLTIESAKHNPVVAAHFKSLALLPIDTELEKLMDEFEFDDEVKSELKSEKSSYKRLGAIIRKIKELEQKRSEAKGSGKAELTNEINKLNQQILDLKKQYEDEINNLKQSHENDLLLFKIENELSKRQYSDALPEAVRIAAAKELLKKEFTEKGIKPVLNSNKSIKLVRQDNTDLSYMENNKEVSFGEFVDKVLSTHAILKVSDNSQRRVTEPKSISTHGANGNSNYLSAVKAAVEQIASN